MCTLETHHALVGGSDAFVSVLLQGSVDRGRRLQSKGMGGSFTEQLETMHQPLENGTEQSRPSSRLGQVEPSGGDKAKVMQMFASMARKPHWQKGKPGAFIWRPQAAQLAILYFHDA